jgi:hypothetical protein
MDAKAERFNLIEPPLLPERPVSPNRFLILAMAVVLALVAAIATVAVREMLDSSVRGPADFDRLLGMIPLGIIPAIDTDEDRRQRGRRRIRFVTATAVVVVTAAVLVHMFVRPLDVLWLSALRRLGV